MIFENHIKSVYRNGFTLKQDASLSESMTICDPKAATGWGGDMFPSCCYRHLADSVGYWPLGKMDTVDLE